MNTTVRLPSEPSDKALVFLNRYPCRLLGPDKIQLPVGLSPDLVQVARTLKPNLLELLREIAREDAEERAGILEFEAGMSRLEAEQRAGLGGAR